MSATPLSETTNEPSPVSRNGHGEISLYLQDIRRIPVLTRAEEVRLVKAMKRGRAARGKLARQALDREAREKLEAVIHEGHAARNQLVAAYARLVVAIATQYVGRGVPLADLIQEGNLGLIAAAQKFDVARGHRFSTYARWWVRNSILREIANHSRTIRLPVYVNEELGRLFRLSRQLAQTLGREPTPDELAESMQLPVETVAWLLQIASEPLSLEEPVGERENNVLGDFVTSARPAALSASGSEEGWAVQLRELVEHLPGKESQVLKLRFGFVDGTPHSLQDIGQALGMSRERVRQIEAAGLDHLRQSKIVQSLARQCPTCETAPERDDNQAQPSAGDEPDAVLMEEATTNA